MTGMRQRVGNTGLSPRVRGNHISPRCAFTCCRSIPACAGEPHPYPGILSGKQVYPRVCGGTLLLADGGKALDGLSPRVRGNPAPGSSMAGHIRSIPACAGEPPDGKLPDTLRRVYPRVCGGTWRNLPLCGMYMGLSPRVRGNLRPPYSPWEAPGSIPACAGEPCITSPSSTPPWVYPRVCGGTEAKRMKKSVRRVYPRVCGGTPRWLSIARHAGGLSPRVRGNPSLPPQRNRPEGSIPACAGEPVW